MSQVADDHLASQNQGAVQRLIAYLARKKRGAILHLAALLGLCWVSWGTYEVLVWIGVDSRLAWLYPLIVDLAVLYVTPYAADASLPADKQWPIRKYAARTRTYIWYCVGAYSVLHMILVILKPAGTIMEQPLPLLVAGWTAGVIAGISPVVFYGRANHLRNMYQLWLKAQAEEQEKQRQARAEAEAREERQALAKIKELEAQAELARAEAERKAAEAEARAAEISAKQAAEPRQPQEEDKEAVAINNAPVEGETGTVLKLPNRTKKEPTKTELAKEYVLKEWDNGREPSGVDVGAAVGASDDIGRRAIRELKAEGYLPPSERHEVALAANSG